MEIGIIEDKYYSYNKYKDAIINVYMDEKLEPYYYPVLNEDFPKAVLINFL